MHVPEQTPLEKSVAVHPDNGVLYAFSQAGEKPLICWISERVTAVVKGRRIVRMGRGRVVMLRILLGNLADYRWVVEAGDRMLIGVYMAQKCGVNL